MGGWVKLALGVLVAALVAVLVVSFTAGDDSTSPSSSSVAEGQPKGSGSKSDAGQGAAKGSKKDGGGKSDGGGSSAAVAAEEGGFTESSGGDESSGSNGSGGQGSKGTGKVGGSDASPGSGKVGKAKKKKSKAGSQAPQLDPEAAAASAVLEAYMAARAGQNWPTACAQMTPKAIRSLERFAAAGRGCVATFTAVSPHVDSATWSNTMSGPIASLGADGVAVYHGTTGMDYTMPMVKEGGAWKVAAVAPTAVS
jgi:hypothetical protein